jgi:hypothetical protein
VYPSAWSRDSTFDVSAVFFDSFCPTGPAVKSMVLVPLAVVVDVLAVVFAVVSFFFGLPELPLAFPGVVVGAPAGCVEGPWIVEADVACVDGPWVPEFPR